MESFLTVGDRDQYELSTKLGSGAFGEVFLGYEKETKREYAIKVEPADAKHPQVQHEAKLYRLLEDGLGTPKVYWIGPTTQGNHVAMVMDLLGPSLEDLFNYCHRKFSLHTVLMLADQMIQRIEYLHSRGFLHRDIKPDNYLIGIGKRQHYIYVVDFGLAKRYKDPRTEDHIPFRNDKSLTGTARYASLNTHNGMEQARRDDLECLGYVLIYFMRGNLPW